jgi:ABC-2 type transport system ATP-binding protein
VGNSRSCLDPDGGYPVDQAGSPRQWRFAGAGPHPVAVGPPGRVDEHGINATQLHLANIGVHGGDRLPHRVDRCVEHGHPQVQRVTIDRDDVALAGQRDEIAPDATTQICHAGGLDKARRPVPGNHLRRGLLQTSAGEEHPVCPGELLSGVAAQLVLGQRRGHQLGRVITAQDSANPQFRVRGDDLVRQPIQQLRTARTDQGLQLRQAVIDAVQLGAPSGDTVFVPEEDVRYFPEVILSEDATTEPATVASAPMSELAIHAPETTGLTRTVPVLEIDRVSKRYGDVVALRELSFRVRGGELFGFVGSNGAGKTTAMRIVLGVLAADSGQVRWRGVPLTFQTRRRIGYLPEERGLYPKMRVGEQLEYLAELHGMSARVARQAAGQWIDRLGLGDRRRDEVQKLSLGNQQRVQLAAALVYEPEVLVLDEPFSGLDPVAVDLMAQVLRENADRGVPVVFSSHQLELVERLCDRVGIIADGRMVACGTTTELQSCGTAQLIVDAPGAVPGWADALADVSVLSVEGSTTVLELGAGADDQAVLRAALATGPVREFHRRRPSLAETFRSVVQQEQNR